MPKTEPVASFVNKGASLTIQASTAGHRLEQKHNAIVDGAGRVVDREGGIPVQASIDETKLLVRKIDEYEAHKVVPDGVDAHRS